MNTSAAAAPTHAHSPMPWLEDGDTVKDRDGEAVAQVFGQSTDEGVYRGAGRADANSRLISLAPALIAVADALLLVGRRLDADLVAAGKGRSLVNVPGFEGVDLFVAAEAIIKAAR